MTNLEQGLKMPEYRPRIDAGDASQVASEGVIIALFKAPEFMAGVTMPDELLLVQTTLQKKADAEAIADELVKARLAACVQIAGPVRSVYRWEDKIEREEEFRLSAKIRRAHYSAVADWLEKRHPYATPEIIAMPIAYVSASYLDWVLGEVR